MMNTNQARVIDPVLTKIAQGYADPDFVGSVLFPRVAVPLRGGQIIQFGKEHFALLNMRRAPGSDTKRREFGYAGKPFAIMQDALEAILPRELSQEALNGPAQVDLAARAVTGNMRMMLRGLEFEQATLARDASQYTSTNKVTVATADKWNIDTSNPVTQIEDAKESIRKQIGTRPNVMVLSVPAFKALKNHPKITSHFQYTTAAVIDEQMLAVYFRLSKVVVAESIFADDNGDFQDIWGSDAVLAYVPTSIIGQEEPSFGYTYTLDGNPLVEVPYYDNGRKSWIYGCSFERTPVIAANGAGYLFKSVV